MIVSKVQKQPKLNKVVAVAPQTSLAKSTKSASVAASVPQCCAHSQISERAFEIYEKRGSKPGNDLQDWLRAERQILATH